MRSDVCDTLLELISCTCCPECGGGDGDFQADESEASGGEL